MHIETLAHGNLYQEDAIAIAELAQNVFNPEPLTLDERLSPRSRILPPCGSALRSLERAGR